MVKTIVAIEDEPVILENILEILEMGGYQAHGALNGIKGLNLVRELIPDLILCDIQMPDMDGYSVLMEVRSDPITTRLPLVFITAYADREFQRKGMNLGANDYLTKPFTTEELLDMVDAQLKAYEQREEERAKENELLRKNIIHALPHELRTPLTGILSCSDLLIMDFDEDEVDLRRIEQMVRIINKSGQRLQRLIENYLMYAQIDVYESNPSASPDLRRGEGIETPMEVAIEAARQVAVESSREADIKSGEIIEANVRVSQPNLMKIISELTDNALKFSDKETPVYLTSQLNNDGLTISIQDQGRGMSAEDIQKIGAYMQFERHFYEQQGMGLGLAIARRLTEIHGGRLTIESEPSNGTTVHVWLPLVGESEAV